MRRAEDDLDTNGEEFGAQTFADSSTPKVTSEAERKLTDGEVKATAEEWVGRGKKHVPDQLTAVQITFLHNGAIYEGKLSRTRVEITKTSPSVDPNKWHDWEQVIAVLPSPLDEDHSLQYNANGTPKRRIAPFNTFYFRQQGARDGLTRIAGEFFKALEPQSPKPTPSPAGK